jgi:glycosyltransferase involved in cell wall biosynthesis
MGHDDHREGGPFHDRGNATARSERANLLVVIPALNEEASIGAVIDRVRMSAPPCDVIVVDDGSDDATASQARAAGALVISLPFNLGIGGAVQTGFLFARDNGYEFMAQVDGDGQHNPAALTTLLDMINDDPTLDVVCGSRFLDSSYAYQSSAARRIGIRLFAFALTHTLHQRITDPTSGFRVWNRRAIEFFALSYPHDYPEVESLLMLHGNGFRFSEAAVPMQSRSSGRSSITKLRSPYYMLKVSLALLAGSLRGPLDLTQATLRPEV